MFLKAVGGRTIHSAFRAFSVPSEDAAATTAAAAGAVQAAGRGLGRFLRSSRALLRECAKTAGRVLADSARHAAVRTLVADAMARVVTHHNQVCLVLDKDIDSGRWFRAESLHRSKVIQGDLGSIIHIGAYYIFD